MRVVTVVYERLTNDGSCRISLAMSSLCFLASSPGAPGPCTMRGVPFGVYLGHHVLLRQQGVASTFSMTVHHKSDIPSEHHVSN